MKRHKLTEKDFYFKCPDPKNKHEARVLSKLFPKQVVTGVVICFLGIFYTFDVDPVYAYADYKKRPSLEKLIFVDTDSKIDNPICLCPHCLISAPLMDGFSLLAKGMNGIKNGDIQDLDLQECGTCQALLEWD